MNRGICAVIVTYNRKELLVECLEAIRKQIQPVNAIYIIDNASVDGTPDFLKKKGYISEVPPEGLKEPWEKECVIHNSKNGEIIKLYYVRMNENTGGAGGFYEGVKRGFEKGYDWLWLMDDDAEPKEDCLEVLIKNNKDGIGVLCPIIMGKDGYQLYHHKKISKVFVVDKRVSKNIEMIPDVTKIDANAFVGPLIKSIYINQIGFPLKSLFIWGDDTEYIHRLSRISEVVLCKGAVMFHKDHYALKPYNAESAKRSYYLFRNRIYFIRKYYKYSIIAYIYWAYSAVKTSVLLALKYKLYKVSFYPVKGFFEGFYFNG